MRDLREVPEEELRARSSERRPTATEGARAAQRELSRRRYMDSHRALGRIAGRAIERAESYGVNIHCRTWSEWALLVSDAIANLPAHATISYSIRGGDCVTARSFPNGAYINFWPPHPDGNHPDGQPVPPEHQRLAWRLAQEARIDA